MTVRQFLSETSEYGLIRPKAILADGAVVSIQFSYIHYSDSINNVPISVEVRTTDLPELEKAMVDDYIAAYFPIDLLEKIVEQHGGIKEIGES